MSDQTFWCWLCEKCERMYGQGITIPSTLSDDPMKKFEANDMTRNVFRFVVFIMCLQRHPQVFEWFRVIREHCPDLVKSYVITLTTRF